MDSSCMVCLRVGGIANERTMSLPAAVGASACVARIRAC